MRFFRPFRPLLKGWLLSAAIFGALAFLVVGQFAWTVSMPWKDAWRMVLREWLPWALVTPLIFRLAGRLPIERERWRLALPAHLLCGMAVVFFCNWWAENVFPPQFGRFGPRRPPEQRTAEPGSAATPRQSSAPPPSRSSGPPRGRPFSFLFLLGFRLPIYLAIVSVAHAVHFYRHSQERERRTLGLEASLAKARLQALRMQLQPHFLFNALNAIAALVHSKPDVADEMLAALSDLLRLTLETSDQQELPLRKELELVERYLAIEHVRFGDRLRYRLDLAPGTENAAVPTFLLQPLVENSVRHGIEPHGREGLLTITSRKEGDSLRLTIQDNGVGLSQSAPAREGIGLANTRARLRELYDTRASLHLRATDGGACVDVALPFRTIPA